MKKVILFILLILIGGNMQAQSYDNYLHTAVNLLNDGNIDAAKRAYEIYKQLSDKSDSTFEELLDKAKKEESWMDSCNIVDLGNGNFIAVQKDDSKIALKYDEAKQRCESNRLGGFCDWRLPSEVELSIIFSTINWSNHNYYWTSFHTKSEEGSKGSDFYLCKDNWRAINTQGEKMNITLQGGWSGIYSKSGVYINGHMISVYIDKLPKCKYLIVRKFTK